MPIHKGNENNIYLFVLEVKAANSRQILGQDIGGEAQRY